MSNNLIKVIITSIVLYNTLLCSSCLPYYPPYVGSSSQWSDPVSAAPRAPTHSRHTKRKKDALCRLSKQTFSLRTIFDGASPSTSNTAWENPRRELRSWWSWRSVAFISTEANKRQANTEVKQGKVTQGKCIFPPFVPLNLDIEVIPRSVTKFA